MVITLLQHCTEMSTAAQLLWLYFYFCSFTHKYTTRYICCVLWFCDVLQNILT